MRYSLLACLLVLAACGTSTTEPTGPILAGNHYDCEGHKVDVDHTANTVTLRRSSGNTVMVAAPSAEGLKYVPQNKGKKSPIFRSMDDKTTLHLGKRAFKCNVVTK